ncbi:MAG: hypothetical protein ACTSWA_05280 [Candidatus Thorarchaeota archaeon]
MKEMKIRAFRWKTDEELAGEALLTDTPKEKLKKTISFFVIARPLKLPSGRRCVEFRSGKTTFVVPSRDLAHLLRDQEFDVTDLRQKKHA